MNLIAQTPENWIRTRIGKYCEVQLGKMLQNDPSSDRDQLRPYLRAINVGKQGLDLSHEFSMWIRPQETELFLLRKGDVLVSEGGDAGRPAIFDADGEYYFQNAINRVRPNYHGKIEPDFIYYWFKFLKASGYVSMICNVATIPHFTAEKVKAAPLALPPLATQRRIARFLDEKTARIDGLIEKKRALLDLLAEKRQALITRAVTKGLEPDGRITPEQSGGAGVFDTDGGIGYFAHGNELPERVAHILKGDWDSSWLKWSVDLSTNRPTEEEQETLPYISNESIESWTGELLVKEREPESAGAADGRMFKKNDVLFNKLRPYLAKVHHATFDGVSSGELLCLRPTHAVEPRFLFYALLSKGFIDKVNAETFGAKMPRADWEIIGHQPLPLPSLATQRQTARFLDEKTAQIDELHGLVIRSVDKLAEYRSALITAAVTGQLPDLQ